MTDSLVRMFDGPDAEIDRLVAEVLALRSIVRKLKASRHLHLERRLDGGPALTSRPRQSHTPVTDSEADLFDQISESLP